MVKNQNAHLFVSIVFGLIWIIDGLIINLLQFTCYLLIRPFSKAAFRKINYYLIYSSWSQVIALAEYWTKCKITVYYPDEDSEKYFGREHSITLMNHKYEVDWLYTWIICDKFHALGSAKTFAKKSLKWIPVVGWGWIFCEMIFLSRSWEKDSLILGQSLDRLMEYADKVSLLIFAEGTRFTAEKYQNSVKYCKEKGLHVLKHHLFPRTRGFVFTVQRLHDEVKAVYNIQLAFSEDETAPTLMNILRGKSLHGHLYIERVPLDKISIDSEEDISKFLLDIYKKKDELMSYFLERGHFPGRVTSPGRRIYPLLNMLFWVISISGIFFYFAYNLVLNKSYILLSIISFLIISGLISFYILIRSTKAKKGSSYGTSGLSKSKTNGNSGDTIENKSTNETLRKRIIASN